MSTLPASGNLAPAPKLRAQVDAQLAQARGRKASWRGWMRSALVAVFSFETLYILFVWSGLYKSDPHLDWVPGDLTAELCFFSVLAGILILVRQGILLKARPLNLLWLFLALCAWLWITTMWSPSFHYANRKALFVPTLTLWVVFAAAFIIARDEARLKRFFHMLLAFSAFVTLETAFTLKDQVLHAKFGLIRALGSVYGTLGLMIGFGALLLFLYGLYYIKKPLLRIVIAVLILSIMVLLLFLGSRTALVFPVLAAMIPLSLSIRWPRTPGKLLAWMGVFLFFALAGVIAFRQLLGLVPGGPTTLKRFATLERKGLDSEGRVRNIEFAGGIIHDSTFSELLFGHGIGSWPILLQSPDKQRYPHNVSVELLVEVGLIGLALFWAMIVYSLKCLGPLKSIRTDPMRIILLTMFFSSFLIAHVSGDLHENRPIFVLMGLMTWDWRKRTPLQ